MSVAISTEWVFRDLQTIILENEQIRLIILPELGAKMWKLIYKPKDRDLLWQHPRMRPRKLPLHSVFDDTFFGGWDELFPNDLAETVDGEHLPDHGEIWTLPWDYEITNRTEEEVTLHLWVETPVTSCRVEKWITLKTNDKAIHFRHKVQNLGHKAQPYLWKLHAAMKVDSHTRIDMGATKAYLEDFGPTRNGETDLTYDWPTLQDKEGNQHDMGKVLPSSSAMSEFQYGLEMNEGWCSITDTKDQIGFGLAFDKDIFTTCWLFSTYGGWRNLNTVVLEPCTGYPVSLNDGIERGTHQILSPGECIDTEIVAVVYEGVEKVSSITRSGEVHGS